MSTRQGLAANLGPGIQVWSVQFTYADLAAIVGSGNKTVNLFNFNGVSTTPMTFPQGSFVLAWRVKHSVAFAGGTLTALTVEVGKSGGATNFFCPALDIFQAVADGNLYDGPQVPLGQLSAVTPTVTFKPTGDSVSAATAGIVNIDFVLVPITTPSAL